MRKRAPTDVLPIEQGTARSRISQQPQTGRGGGGGNYATSEVQLEDQSFTHREADLERHPNSHLSWSRNTYAANTSNVAPENFGFTSLPHKRRDSSQPKRRNKIVVVE